MGLALALPWIGNGIMEAKATQHIHNPDSEICYIPQVIAGPSIIVNIQQFDASCSTGATPN